MKKFHKYHKTQEQNFSTKKKAHEQNVTQKNILLIFFYIINFKLINKIIKIKIYF